MTKLFLKRVIDNGKTTFGVLIFNNIPACVTLEPPWINNNLDISCIPAGIYKYKKYSSEKFKDVWEILDVPNRHSILIHSGNYVQDTHGCVIIGKEFTQSGVALSRMALDDLRKILPDEGTITIGN